MASTAEPDYEKLRAILERQLGREVSLEYAVGAGNFLINVYDVLLYSETSNERQDILITTPERKENDRYKQQ